jgi:hypothetical protein
VGTCGECQRVRDYRSCQRSSLAHCLFHAYVMSIRVPCLLLRRGMSFRKMAVFRSSSVNA